ncbi:MAG: hypothetical protein ACE5PM_03110 [Candidatus Hydrothermarchaeales archaeon]
MNIKKAIVCGLIGYVAFVIVGAVFGNILPRISPYLVSGVTGTIPPAKIVKTMLGMGLIECISFAIIFDVFYEGIPGEGVYKGLIYGFVLWWINMFTSNLAGYGFGYLLLADIIYIDILKVFMLPGYGAILGWAYQKLKI